MHLETPGGDAAPSPRPASPVADAAGDFDAAIGDSDAAAGDSDAAAAGDSDAGLAAAEPAGDSLAEQEQDDDLSADASPKPPLNGLELLTEGEKHKINNPVERHVSDIVTISATFISVLIFPLLF
jgi:hypothetical protein